jgi:hypothetical protein
MSQNPSSATNAGNNFNRQSKADRRNEASGGAHEPQGITLFCAVVHLGGRPLGRDAGPLGGREEAGALWRGTGKVKDEALCVGRGAESLPGADEDYLADMDYGVTKDPREVAARLQPFMPGISPDEAVKRVVKGRNNWILWTGGNDRLWDVLSVKSIGNLDFLKTLSNHPSLKYSRDSRWRFLGVVNEPCFEKGKGPREDRWGLWLDTRRADCPPDPFEDEQKYPGVKIGARGTEKLPVGSYYGYATGVVGLRLFPNPAFDAAAQGRWDAEKFYTDSDYYNDRDLVRPYRVGMSCGFCHVGPNPTNPPADPENPKWENLNSNPGAQYFWWDRIFIWNPDPKDFPWQLFHALPPRRPRHLDGFDRLHHQPAHHERHLQLWSAHEERAPVRPGRARGGGARQCPVRRLRLHPQRQRAPQVLRGTHVVDPAGPKRRRRLGGGARGAQPGVRQHRPLQRGVALAFQRAGRRPEDHPLPDRDGAQQLRVLAGDRGADTRYCASSRPRGPTPSRTHPAGRVT